MKKLFTLLFCFCLLGLNAQILYDADFSTDGDGFPDHTTSSPPTAGPTSASGGTSPNNWTVSYNDTPSTDGSANEFGVKSGVIRIQDWGDTEATWLSAPIDISGSGLITISALGDVIGSDVQNGGGEFFQYFYILDSEAPVVFVVGGGPTGPETDSGDPVNLDISELDVNDYSSIQIGFSFLVNGSNDGYEISSVIVTQNALPVELTKFNATKRSDKVFVAWQTATEINNDRFEIERSYDAKRFETIGKVVGEGNSQRLVDYTFVDDAPLSGVNYYRLKQVDIDGAFEYSDVVSVKMGKTANIRITPTSTLDYVTVNTGEASSIVLRSINGQVMNSQSDSEGNFTVDMANLPQGIYYLTIAINGSLQTEKVVRL